MSIEHAMEVQQLRDELAHARRVVSRAINMLEQVRIALEDGDTDEALRIITEATK
jgi:phosphopantothenate synthetase